MKSKIFDGILVVTLVCAVLAAHVYWVSADKTPYNQDIASHMTQALKYHDLFTSPSRAHWDALFSEGAYYYPPLTQMVGAVVMVFVGRNPALLPMSLMLFTLLLVLCAVLFAKRFFEHDEFAPAIMAVLFLPGLVWLSRMYFLDYPLAAMVTLGWLLVLRALEKQTPGASLLAGFVLGLGALVKITFALYLLGPLAWYMIQSVRIRHEKTGSLKNLAVLITGGAAVALPQYIANAQFILDVRSRFAQDGVVDGEPGSGLGLLTHYFTTISQIIPTPWLILLCAGLVVAFIRFLKTRSMLGHVALLAVPPFLILTLLQNKDPRYLAPLLPALGFISLSWIDAISKNALRKGATFFVAMFLGAGFYFQSINPGGKLQAAYESLSGMTLRIDAPDRSDWKTEEIWAAIVEDNTSDQITLCVLPWIDPINSLVFDMLAVRDHKQIVDTGVSWRVRTEPDFIEQIKNTEFVLTKTGKIEDFRYPYSDNLYGLEKPDSKIRKFFQVVKEIDLPDGSKAILFRNKGTAQDEDLDPAGIIPTEAYFEAGIALTGMAFVARQDDKEFPYRLILKWQTDTDLEKNWMSLVHFEGQGKFYSFDHVPDNWSMPTSKWLQGKGIIDSVPIKLPPGKYRLYLSWYQEANPKALMKYKQGEIFVGDRYPAGEIEIPSDVSQPVVIKLQNSLEE